MQHLWHRRGKLLGLLALSVDCDLASHSILCAEDQPAPIAAAVSGHVGTVFLDGGVRFLKIELDRIAR